MADSVTNYLPEADDSQNLIPEFSYFDKPDDFWLTVLLLLAFTACSRNSPEEIKMEEFNNEQ